MRFKNEIFQEYHRYLDEKRHLDYWKEKDEDSGRERLAFFNSMELEEFNRLFNTYSWLVKYNNPLMRMGETDPVHPTTQEIKEAVQLIGESGKDLRLHARQHEPGRLKEDLQKMATKKIKCGVYYTELADSGFYVDKVLHFRDKEIDAWRTERERDLII